MSGILIKVILAKLNINNYGRLKNFRKFEFQNLKLQLEKHLSRTPESKTKTNPFYLNKPCIALKMSNK